MYRIYQNEGILRLKGKIKMLPNDLKLEISIYESDKINNVGHDLETSWFTLVKVIN